MILRHTLLQFFNQIHVSFLNAVKQYHHVVLYLTGESVHILSVRNLNIVLN